MNTAISLSEYQERQEAESREAAARMLDIQQMKERMARPVLVDMRNIYDADTMRGLGFAYTGVGV